MCLFYQVAMNLLSRRKTNNRYAAPDDDDVEAVLGLMRKRTFKPKKKKLINKEMLSTKAVYLTLASGQRVKKYTLQKEQQKFTPSKPWIPYRSQVSVAQVQILVIFA